MRANIFDDSFLSTDDIAVLEGMLRKVDGRGVLVLNILNRAFDLGGHHWEMRIARTVQGTQLVSFMKPVQENVTNCSKSALMVAPCNYYHLRAKVGA